METGDRWNRGRRQWSGNRPDGWRGQATVADSGRGNLEPFGHAQSPCHGMAMACSSLLHQPPSQHLPKTALALSSRPASSPRPASSQTSPDPSPSLTCLLPEHHAQNLAHLAHATCQCPIATAWSLLSGGLEWVGGGRGRSPPGPEVGGDRFGDSDSDSGWWAGMGRHSLTCPFSHALLFFYLPSTCSRCRRRRRCVAMFSVLCSSSWRPFYSVVRHSFSIYVLVMSPSCPSAALGAVSFCLPLPHLCPPLAALPWLSAIHGAFCYR